MLGNERFEQCNDLLLLTPWQIRSFGKQVPHFSNRTGAALFAGGSSEKFFDGNVERRGEVLKLIRTERHRAAFPMRVRPLRKAQLVGQLLLSQASGFTQPVQALAKGGALLC